MTRTKPSAVALAVMLVLASAATPAAAQTDTSNPLDEWFDENSDTEESDDDPGVIDSLRDMIPSGAADALAILDGQIARATPSNPFVEPRTNSETAQAFDTVVEEHNQTFERKINQKTNVTTAYDTHGVVISHSGSETVAVYVLGDVENGNISNLRVLTQSDFNATNRTVDEIWAVDGDAAENLPTLISELADRIASGQSVGRSYQARLGGRYCSPQNPISGDIADLEHCDVRSTIWLTEEEVLNGGTDE